MSNFNKYPRYVIGIYCITLGIVILTYSGFGVTSWDVFTIGMSQITSLSPGMWIFIVGVVLIFITALMTKRKPNYPAILIGLLIGFLVNINFMILNETMFVTYPNIFGLISIVIIAFGIALYVRLDLAITPIEDFMLGWNYLGFSMTTSRLLTDGLGLLLGILIGGISMGLVGIGTILIYVLLSPLIGFFDKILNKKIIN